MCANSLDFSKLDLVHYTYNELEKKFYLKNKNISSYYISIEQVKIYDFLKENDLELFIDAKNIININKK